jgi:hypothetical protein
MYIAPICPAGGKGPSAACGIIVVNNGLASITIEAINKVDRIRPNSLFISLLRE